MLLVGVDWAERHHDVCLMATDGKVLARERITDGVVGVARLHEFIAGYASDPGEVVVGTETDPGGAGGGRLSGDRGESVGSQPLSGAPHHLGGPPNRNRTHDPEQDP